MVDEGFSYEDAIGSPPAAAGSPLAPFASTKNGFSYEDAIGTPQPAPSPTDIRSRISSDIAAREQSSENLANRAESGEINPVGFLGGTLREGLGTMGDIAGEVGKSAWEAVPSFVRNPVESGAKYVGSELAKTPEGMAVSAAAPLVESEYSEWAKNNPNAAEWAGAAGNLAKDLPMAGGLKAVGELGAEAAPDIAAAAKRTSPIDLLKNTASGGADVIPSPAGPGWKSFLDRATSTHNNLEDAKNDLYQQAENFGFGFTPEGSSFVPRSVSADVKDQIGVLDSQNHPRTKAALRTLQKVADDPDGFTLKSEENVRSTLNDIIANSDNKTDARAARAAKTALDSAVTTASETPGLSYGSPAALDALQSARKAHSLLSQYSDLRDIVRNAKGSTNAIKSGIDKLYENNDMEKYPGGTGILPANEPIVKTIANPNALMRGMQGIGHIGFGGDYNRIPYWETAAVIPAAVFNPAAAAATAAGIGVGTAANLTRGAIIKSGVKTMLHNLEEASRAIPSSFTDPEYEANLAEANKVPPKVLGLPAPSINMPAEQSGLYRRLPAPDPNELLPNGERRYPLVNDRTGNFGEPARGKLRPMTQAELENYIANQQKLGGSDIITPAERGAAQARATTEEAARMRAAEEAFAKNPRNQTEITPEELRQNLTNYPQDIPPYLKGKFARGGSVDTQPTEKQIAAGNYRKGHLKLHGLDISIENPKGSERRGADHKGKAWSVVMPHHYGYIKGSVGADGQHVDCFLGDDHKSQRVYVIDQKKHDGGFDEHKCMLCFKDRDAAVKAYKDSFSDKKNRIMKVTRFTIPEFKEWLKRGNTKKPVGKAA